MENKTFTHIQNLSSNSDTIKKIARNSSVLPPTINTTTTSLLQTLQTVPVTQSTEINSGNNNTNKRSNIFVPESTFRIKQEHFEDNSQREEYSIGKNKLTTNQSKTNHSFQPTVTSVHLDPRDTIHGLPAISMSTANINGHLMSNLNPTHLSDGAGTYFVSGLPSDLTSNYKLPRSSNSDLPSPSTSSTSSNPSSLNHHHHHPHHQAKRHDEGGDPTRKRAVRLEKNRDAARECRRKKKEYINCLEERVTGLETQNKALIEELRELKELYCKREETNNNNNTPNKTTSSTR